MPTNNSQHLRRVDLPEDLHVGTQILEGRTTVRHDGTFTLSQPFEVVETLPDPNWQDEFWN